MTKADFILQNSKDPTKNDYWGYLFEVFDSNRGGTIGTFSFKI